MAYNFHPLPRLLCAWHWSSTSVTMSVYLSNHTKWPPITCPIDLSRRWSLVDNSFYHITAVLSSAGKWKGPSEQCSWCEINQPIAVGCMNITVWSGWMMTVSGHHGTWGWCIAGNRWRQMEYITVLFNISRCTFHLSCQHSMKSYLGNPVPGLLIDVCGHAIYCFICKLLKKNPILCQNRQTWCCVFFFPAFVCKHFNIISFLYSISSELKKMCQV